MWRKLLTSLWLCVEQSLPQWYFERWIITISRSNRRLKLKFQQPPSQRHQQPLGHSRPIYWSPSSSRRGGDSIAKPPNCHSIDAATSCCNCRRPSNGAITTNPTLSAVPNSVPNSCYTPHQHISSSHRHRHSPPKRSRTTIAHHNPHRIAWVLTLFLLFDNLSFHLH